MERRKTGIIIGNTGVGKTTLFNILTTNKYKTGSSRHSSTKSLFISPVNTGSTPFDIIDTPGIDSNKEPLKDSLPLRHPSTVEPLDTIFLVIKYNNKFDKIEDELLRVSEIVYKYDRKIVVMISHMDVSENAREDEREIREVLKDYEYLIFYDKFTLERNLNLLADKMFEFMFVMVPERLEIEDCDFFANFRVYELKRNQKREFIKYEKEIKKIKAGFIEHINDFGKNGSLNDEILHSMIINFRYILEDLINTYLEKFKTEMDDLNYYGFAIKLQNDSIKNCNDFSLKLGNLMTYNLNNMKDPRNLIKRCPFCKEIWYKVSGCDGETLCGTEPEYKNDIIRDSKDIKKEIKKLFTHCFEWCKGKLLYLKKKDPKKNNDSFLSISNSEQKNEHDDTFNSVQELISMIDTKKPKRRGSGNSIIWKDLPALDEEILLSIFNVKSFEQVNLLIKNEDYVNSYYDVRDNVDFKIHKKDCKCEVCKKNKI